jgi:hypothetical protein
MALSRMPFNELGPIESKNATISASSKTGVWEDSRTNLGGLARDYTQLPLASRANQRAPGGPPSVVFELICFPDADPTMPPRDRPLHSQVRADDRTKCQK